MPFVTYIEIRTADVNIFTICFMFLSGKRTEILNLQQKHTGYKLRYITFETDSDFIKNLRQLKYTPPLNEADWRY